MTSRPYSSFRRDGSADRLARGLGWFSIALGAAELAAPGYLGRALGMEDRTGLLRAYGLREIAAGIGILAAADPKPWIWGRVAGDALDIATLSTRLDRDNPQRASAGAALGAVAAVTALDLYCARRLAASSGPPPSPMRDYSDRSGFPDRPERMRGLARGTPARLPG